MVERVEQVQSGTRHHAGPLRIRPIQRHFPHLDGEPTTQHLVGRPGTVGRDPVRPGAKRGPTLEPAYPLGHRQQGVLARFFRVFAVGKETRTHPQHLRAYRHQQRVQRAWRVLGGGSGQPFKLGAVPGTVRVDRAYSGLLHEKSMRPKDAL